MYPADDPESFKVTGRRFEMLLYQVILLLFCKCSIMKVENESLENASRDDTYIVRYAKMIIT